MLTVTIKANDGFNNKPSWNSDFEALENEITFYLEDTVKLNYTALDIDPEDIVRSRISDFGDSQDFLSLITMSGGTYDV